jgi:DNA polymerase theta
VLMQAQPNKVKLGAKDEQKFKDKLLAKARIIADSANRLWRKHPSIFTRLGRLANQVPCRDRDAAGAG